MWINVRCFNIHKVPVWVWLVTCTVIIVLAVLKIVSVVRKRREI